MSDGSRKRSRFDQTENVDARKSRFDRRSKSPERRRSRSPAASESAPGNTSKPTANALSGAAAAAAAAAARITAQIAAQKAAGTLPVAVAEPVANLSAANTSTSDANGLKTDIYEQDGDWIKDIEVNDLRNRYTLTKGATQKMIKEKTGADVTTRGAYYPDKSMATAVNPPLYLHITSTTKEGLEKAVVEIEEMMKQDLPNLIDERRMPRQRREPEFERDERGRRKWPEERIPINLEPINGFNLRAQVVGSGGSYVKHIQGETNARVQIKGRGSGFYEHDTGVESDESMYLHVVAPEQGQVDRAKELCMDLLGNVRTQYEAFKERGNNRGGYGDHNRGNNHNHGYGQDNSNNDRPHNTYAAQDGNTSQYGGQQSPAANDYAAQYAAYYGQQATGADGTAGAAVAAGTDPYAQYGGYEQYLQWYQYYASMQQQQQQQQQQGQQLQTQPGIPGYDQQNGSAVDTPPPPPPAAEEAAPPPPPPSSGGYNAVPPPPGM